MTQGLCPREGGVCVCVAVWVWVSVGSVYTRMCVALQDFRLPSRHLASALLPATVASLSVSSCYSGGPKRSSDHPVTHSLICCPWWVSGRSDGVVGPSPEGMLHSGGLWAALVESGVHSHTCPFWGPFHPCPALRSKWEGSSRLCFRVPGAVTENRTVILVLAPLTVFSPRSQWGEGGRTVITLPRET